MRLPVPDLFLGPVHIKWLNGTPAPTDGAANTVVFHEGKVYVGGGDGDKLYKINVYTPASDSWSPFPINTSYKYFTMTTLNNQLITAGGLDRYNEVTNEILSLSGNHLKKYTRMITSRQRATAAGHQGTLIIAGGRGQSYHVLATTDLFDSTTGQWYAADDLPLPHCELKSVIIDNQLYVLGGLSQDNMSPAVFTAPLDTLSSHQLKWSPQQDTPWCRSAPVSIQDRHLLIIGGAREENNSFMRTSNIYKYNKIIHSWEVIGQIPSARSRTAAVSIADNKIVVVGGSDDSQHVGYTTTVWIGSCEPQ